MSRVSKPKALTGVNESVLEDLLTRTNTALGKSAAWTQMELRAFTRVFLRRLCGGLIYALGLDLETVLQDIRNEWHRCRAEEDSD